MQEEQRIKDAGDRTEDGIMAWYFFEQYHSPRFWNTVEKARDRFRRVRGKMRAVKEQIMIVSIGLGLEEAHHPWSKDNYNFKADELFDHFVNVVLPLIKKLEKEGRMPTEAPLSLPSQPNLVQLGTMSELAEDIFQQPEMDDKSARAEILKEIKRREAKGEGDIWEQCQDVVGPEINSDMTKKLRDSKLR